MQGNTNAVIGKGGGGGATVTAINKTGSTITTGQKVWLNEQQQTQGSNYQIGVQGNYQNIKLGAIDRTGLFGHYYGKFYSIGEDSATEAGTVSDSYFNMGSIKYMADNSIFANLNYAYRFDGKAQWYLSYDIGLGDNIFINRNNYSIYQADMSNGSIINTFTNNDITYLNAQYSLVKVGNNIYRVSGNAQYKWTINYDTNTITRSSYSFTNTPYQYDMYPADVTADNKYILCGDSTTAYSNSGTYLYMVEVLEDGNLKGLSQSEMPVDMQKWYSTKCGYVFNPYTGILTVYEYLGSDYGIYKYENGTWTQLPIDLGLAEGTQLAAPITVSDDLSRACYSRQYSSGSYTYNESHIVNLTTTQGYAAVPYKFYNVTENTITGYAGNDTEADGEVIVGVASVSV